MIRKAPSLSDWLTYALLRLTAAMMGLLPLRFGVALACRMSDLVFRLDRRHRETALRNLRESFPGRWSEAELQQVARGVYRHFATMLVEMVFIPRKIRPENWRERVTGPGVDVLEREIASGRPLLVVTGHFGNWELGAYMFGLYGARGCLVARQLDNPLLDRVFVQFREQTGMTVLNKSGCLATITAELNARGLVCLLADQDAGARGDMVTFFDRPASTTRVVELLAAKTGATIVVVGVRRGDRPLDYTIDVSEIIRPEEYRGREETLNQRVATGLETIIRRAPEQYLWLHRRWKTQRVRRERRRAA